MIGLATLAEGGWIDAPTTPSEYAEILRLFNTLDPRGSNSMRYSLIPDGDEWEYIDGQSVTYGGGR